STLYVGTITGSPRRSGRLLSDLQLHRQQTVEEGAVALQAHSQVFGGDVVSAAPLLLELAPLLRENLGEALDRPRDQLVRLLDGMPGLVHEAGLDAMPIGAKLLGLLALEERR